MRNGQKNTKDTSLCLCLNHKQTRHFLQKRCIPNFLIFLRKFELKVLLKFLIYLYQASFSYFFGGNCRYYPSCSHYAQDAFSKFNVIDASWLVLKRLLSCHPFSKRSFYDPVPINIKEKSSSL